MSSVTRKTITTSGSYLIDEVDLDADTQTITGVKTFNFGKFVRSGGTLAALGTSQTTAAPIVHAMENVSGADGTVGVRLPVTTAGGQSIMVKNNVAAVLKVYPGTGGTINAITADGAISMASLTSAIFFCTAANTWFTIPLLPS